MEEIRNKSLDGLLGEISKGVKDNLYVSHYRFEHNCLDNPILLTKNEASTLNDIAHAAIRNKEQPRIRSLSYLKTLENRSIATWTIDAIEKKLISTGLLELEPNAEYNDIYRCSEMSRTGEYFAVLREKTDVPKDPHFKILKSPYRQ
jgi:hypothetical protein